MTEQGWLPEQANNMNHILYSLYEHSSYKQNGLPIKLFFEIEWKRISTLLSTSLTKRGIANTLLHDQVSAARYDRTGRLNRDFPDLDISGLSLEQTGLFFSTDRTNNMYGFICRPTPDLNISNPLCIINGPAKDVRITTQQMLGGMWNDMPTVAEELAHRPTDSTINGISFSRLPNYITSVPAPIPPDEYYKMVDHLYAGVSRTQERLHTIMTLVQSLYCMYPQGHKYEIPFEFFPTNMWQLSDVIYAFQLLGNEAHIEINQTGEIHIKTNPSQHYIKSEISTVRGNLEQLLKGLTNQEVIDSHLFRLLQVTDQPLVNQVNTSIRRLMQSWKNGKLSDEKNLIEALILFLETEFLKTQTDSDTYPAEDRRQ